jgi:lysozyme
MEPSPALLHFLAQPQMENCKLVAYSDGIGIPTIGIGHTKNVEIGNTCTLDQAYAWALKDLATASDTVNAAITKPMLQREFDAFCSLCFNIGAGNFMKHFSGVGLFNMGQKQMCADHFLLWNKAGGEVEQGLVTRRTSERAMFLGLPNEFLAAYC